MRLRELMHTGVVTIESTKAASVAWSRMRKHRIRHLVVTANGDLAGVISERDLGGADGNETRKGRRVQDLMRPRVVSAEPATTLQEAAKLMRGRRIGSLPVVDGERLVGIVTATDVLDELGRGSIRPAPRHGHRPVRMAETRRQSDGAAKRELPEEALVLPIHIRSREGELGPHEREHIRRKLGRRLGKFSSSIERISVRTKDVNGPRGGIDRMCRIKVVLSALPSVVYESRGASVDAAVDDAVAGVERAVRRTLRRRRMKPLRRPH